MKTWLNCAIFSHYPSPDFQIVFHADTDFSSVTTIYQNYIPFSIGSLKCPNPGPHSPYTCINFPHVACSSTLNVSNRFL
jgi:hypothetical protein